MTEFTVGITPGFQLSSLTAGPDGNLWFTEYTPDPEAGMIGRITPTGTVTKFSAGITGNHPRDITAGPDGNLWFTESTDTEQSSQLSTAGGISNGLAWINATGAIARITPAGVVTEFPQASNAPVPNLITAGPDGNLWFTEVSNGQIGQFELTTPATTSSSIGGLVWYDGNGNNDPGEQQGYCRGDRNSAPPPLPRQQPTPTVTTCSPTWHPAIIPWK